MNELRLRVKEARMLAGLSQEAFAVELGVTRSAVANWEVGNNAPEFDNLAAIAKRSGMMFEYLCTGRGPKLFGAPRVEETPAAYVIDDPLLRSIVDRVRALPPRKQRALLALMDSPLFGK